MAGIKWDIVTEWTRLESDTGKRFEQRVALYDPSGAHSTVAQTNPVDSSAPNHRHIATVFGFPIGSTGRYTLRLWLSENGQEQPEPVAEFWITLIHEVLDK
jgi:hypothetical protein